MSNYTQTTDFSAKDALASGNAEKVILGADIDVELSAISTAIASKLDDAGLLSDIDDLNDPGADRLLFWDDSAGAVAFLSAGTAIGITGTSLELSHLGFEDLVDPNADRIAFWDDSAGNFDWLVPSTGLTISGTNLTTDDSAIVHDNLSGFVANEHINHGSVSITAGSGLTGGGTIAASRTINVGAGSGISVAADSVAVDSTVIRTTGSQTIGGTKTFTALPLFTGEGQFIHHAASQSGASVTISDSAPSGGANGDIWLEY